ncbi:methionine ABC transporter ATP-binding protein [Peptostreptococcus equinus]|uniref:ATP-binding cassette domain-containing protein n=1 Tax=Peptostreptococcus equinus TaxID=3003601 RepID=A0ABY7JRJ8_9FIRM|nr:ATP-binding cassette domain-containing protein [Peptostreptococcus sp. CBA3647]WAW14798.1 ATP-binding cassette domain-containing protein [Peptostreptococcus sp. CBA3647]
MIELINVSKSFKQNKNTISALKTTNLKIKQGEIFGIIGYSGAGKSTLLRCINLLETPSSGKIIVDGQTVNELNKKELRKYRQKVGIIFQQFNLIKSKTVYENIEFNLKAGNTKKEDISRRVDELLELVGLTDKRNEYPNQLSGGQKQRVGIAKALANNPKILLCDEATSALDPVTTKQILNLLKQINDKLAITIIIVTHEMEVIKETCQRVAVMEKGQIIEQNSVFEIFANPKTKLMQEFVYNTRKNFIPSNLIKSFDGDKLIELTFKGHTANKPIVYELAKKHNVAVNIFGGNIEHLEDKQLGTLILSLEGKEQNTNEMIDYLNNKVEGVEVKRYA